MSLLPPDGPSDTTIPGLVDTGSGSSGSGRGASRAIAIVLAVVVAIGLMAAAGFGVATLARKAVDPAATFAAGPSQTPRESSATPSAGPETLSVPTVADANGGFLVNLDGTVGGEPPAGAVRVDVYLDLLCPICHEFETINEQTINSLRADGTIAVYYHPVSILDRYSSGTRYPTRAASALTTVAQYDPSHFEAFLGALFDNQPAEGSKGLSDAKIAQIAIGVGVPTAVADTFADASFAKWVTDQTDAASVDGFRGTPWVRADLKAELDGSIWSDTASLRAALQSIHDHGVQAYLHGAAAA